MTAYEHAQEIIWTAEKAKKHLSAGRFYAALEKAEDLNDTVEELERAILSVISR